MIEINWVVCTTTALLGVLGVVGYRSLKKRAATRMADTIADRVEDCLYRRKHHLVLRKMMKKLKPDSCLQDDITGGGLALDRSSLPEEE